MSYFEFPHTRTYDSDLGWLIKTVKKLVECCNEMTDWKDTHENQYKELKQLYDDLIAGRFPESIKNAFETWMRKNALDLVGELVKQVYFGLTDTGYFVAYIPESWSDIDFFTSGWDDYPENVNYGHLILKY